MNYYQSSITKKIMTENYLKVIDQVYGEGRMNDLINDGIVSEVPHPTVEECIYYGSNSVAVIRYKEVYGVTWDEANKAVRKLRKKMQRADHRNVAEAEYELVGEYEETDEEE